MGLLIYGRDETYEFPDRTLAHLKIAITSKLRLRESFLLNWAIPAAGGSGRVSIWLSRDIPLQFRFAASEPPRLNRRWLDALARSARGIRGMVVLSEDEVEAFLGDEASLGS